MKVLIVDDNPDNRRLLTKQINASGYQVVEASNGRDALVKALNDPPDIVVTDVLMPEMDGYQLCMEWKLNDKLKSIPLIFYTATYTSDEDEKFARTIGVDAFISKPTDFPIFMQVLETTLEKAASNELNQPRFATPENRHLLTQYNQLLLSKLYQKVTQLEADIEKRKSAEKALRESEAKYSSLVEHGNDSIVIIQNGIVIYANPILFELTGYKTEEGIGQPFISFIAPGFREHVKDQYQKRIAGEAVPSRYELDLVTKSNTTLSVEVSASLIKLDNVVTEIAMLRDMTERKQAEAALRESEEKFRQFFENAQVYCYMVSPEGLILNVNSCACQALGYSRAELIGQPLSQVYAPESLTRAQFAKMEWDKTGVIENEELKILTKAGEIRDVILSTGAIRNQQGELVSTVSVQKDITELKQSQAKAMQVETLTLLSKAKSELLSNVAHELRTPLAAIKGFIETLTEPDVKWTKKQQLEFLTEASKEVDVLNTLIRDLLDVSRIESGKFKLDKKSYQFKEILEFARVRLATLTTSHVLKIVQSPELPEICVDKMRIAQVITNLVENATKFSPSGSQILMEVQRRESHIVVSITDKGIGMSQETIGQLFDRFYQAARLPSLSTKGTGLGLSICRGIVEAHDGKIWVESRLGEGSTFSFSLPVAVTNQLENVNLNQYSST
jgi:PAS domain S-box-containing protein